MKYWFKKLVAPVTLALVGVGIALLISLFNPKTETNKPIFTTKYIAVKINNDYPFPLLFTKGTSVKTILQKFKIGLSRQVFIKKKPLPLEARLYEDTTLSIS